MFGYVRPDKEEIRLKEYRRYKNYYCAVCNELRKKYGRLTSICVAYELVFTLLLLDDFSEQDSCQTIKLSCQFEAVRIGDIILNKELLSYIAWLNLYLCKWKLFDNWVDDKNIFAYAISKFIELNKNFKKDCLRYVQVSNVLDSKLNMFYNIETNENDVDNLAQIMGEIWREILEPGIQIVNIDMMIFGVIFAFSIYVLQEQKD